MASILIGAVAYDPKVVGIWKGMRTYFRDEAKLDAEVTLFLNYGAQVDALLAGRIDVGWNTNLAAVQVDAESKGACAPIAMRDTDIGWTTVLIATKGGSVRSLPDLRGKTLALGSRDSGHAAILPVHFLAEQGIVEGRDYRSLRFDTDVGLHGDSGKSEVDVLAAVLDGRAEAGAVGSPFWNAAVKDGLVPGNAVEAFWTSPTYNHCLFNARPGLPKERIDAFQKALYAMDWNDPTHRPILEAEGLRRWVPPAVEGHASLRAAAERQGLLRRA